MNYFYDFLVNLNDEQSYKFYEWDKSDTIIHLKKSPVLRINSNDLKDIMSNQIKISQDVLDLIYQKTESYNKDNKILDYMCIFTDGNNSIVMEFDKTGISISRSYLLLEEELDLIEMAYSFVIEEISYECLSPLQEDLEIRQGERIKKFLTIEVNTLYENNNVDKLKYLYKELTNKDEENLQILKDKLLKHIKNDFDESHFKLYEIIELSYRKLST